MISVSFSVDGDLVDYEKCDETCAVLLDGQNVLIISVDDEFFEDKKVVET